MIGNKEGYTLATLVSPGVEKADLRREIIENLEDLPAEEQAIAKNLADLIDMEGKGIYSYFIRPVIYNGRYVESAKYLEDCLKSLKLMKKRRGLGYHAKVVESKAVDGTFLVTEDRGLVCIQPKRYIFAYSEKAFKRLYRLKKEPKKAPNAVMRYFVHDDMKGVGYQLDPLLGSILVVTGPDNCETISEETKRPKETTAYKKEIKRARNAPRVQKRKPRINRDD